MSAKKDLSNMIFGELLVLHEDKNASNRIKWICKCSCGKITSIRSNELIQGQKTCGCSKYKSGKFSSKWKGFEDISAQYFKSIELGAISRKLEFDVSIEYLWSIFLLQNKKCKLSGLNIGFDKNNITASLDRIDNTQGYIIGNIQWVHKHINIMKWIHNQDYFIELCRLVTNENINS